MTLAMRLDSGFRLGSPIENALSEEGRASRSLSLMPEPATPSIYGSQRTEAAVEALESALSEAGLVNWDGHNARAADIGAFVYALELIANLPVSTPLPEMAVDVDGDIAFDWDRGARQILSLRVSGDGTLHYAGMVGQSVFHGSELLGEGLPDAISAALDRVLSESEF